MDQIFKIKDAVVNYLSPAAKRRRTMGPQTPSGDSVPASEQHFFLSEPRDKKAFQHAYDRINQNYLSAEDGRTPSKNRLKRAREDGESGGPAFLGGGVSPQHSSSQVGTEGGGTSIVTPGYEDEAEFEDDAEEEISSDQKVQEYLERQAAEMAMAKERVEMVRESGEWLPEEVYLLERLALRGSEPILPYAWYGFEFKTFPMAMWLRTGDDKDAFLGFHKGNGGTCEGPFSTFLLFQTNNCVAAYALKELTTSLGWRVRASHNTGYGYVEHRMAQIIQHYITWSERDGGFHKKKFVPVLCLVRGNKGASGKEVEKSLRDQMNGLARLHRQTLSRTSPFTSEMGETQIYFRRPPLIYGILCAQTKAIFVTLDSSNPEAQLKHIGHCDFMDIKMDVWNAISVAIVVSSAKHYMVSIKDQLEDDDPVIDPYADELESPADAEKRIRREARRAKREKEREEMLRLERQLEDIEMSIEGEREDDGMEIKNEDIVGEESVDVEAYESEEFEEGDDTEVEPVEGEQTEVEGSAEPEEEIISQESESEEEDEVGEEVEFDDSGDYDDENNDDDEDMAEEYDTTNYPESTSSDELS